MIIENTLPFTGTHLHRSVCSIPGSLQATPVAPADTELKGKVVKCFWTH